MVIRKKQIGTQNGIKKFSITNGPFYGQILLEVGNRQSGPWNSQQVEKIINGQWSDIAEKELGISTK